MKDLTKLSENLKKYREIEFEQLRRTSLGEYSFEDQYDELKEIKKYIDLLSEKESVLASHMLISQSHINQANEIVDGFVSMAGLIIDFKPLEESNPNDKRKNILDRIQTLKINLPNISPIYQYLTENLTSEEYQKSLSAKEEKLDVLIKKVEENEKYSKDALEAIRQTAGKSGAVVHSKIYETKATTHAEVAKKWLITSVILFTLALVYIGYFLFFADLSYGSTPEVVAQSILKVLFLSALTIGLFQSLKNYSANKHLQVVNDHRQSAIDTFQAFYEASADNAELRSAILTQATKTIFELGDTGYLSKGNSQSSLTLNLPDIVQKISRSE